MKQIIGSSIGILLLCACASTDVGNPIDTEISFATYEGVASDFEALTLDNGITLEQAFVKVRGFQLDRSEACDDTSSSYDEPILVDLLTGIRSDVPLWDDEAGTFCRLRIELTSDEVEGEPQALADAALYIQGSYQGETFKLRFEEAPALSLAGPFTLPVGSHLLQVGFFPVEWFGGVELEELASANLPSSVGEKILSNFLESGRLYHDTNQDGILDLIELSTSLAEGK